LGPIFVRAAPAATGDRQLELGSDHPAVLPVRRSG
jgi:hypothetical protein